MPNALRRVQGHSNAAVMQVGMVTAKCARNQKWERRVPMTAVGVDTAASLELVNVTQGMKAMTAACKKEHTENAQITVVIMAFALMVTVVFVIQLGVVLHARPSKVLPCSCLEA